MRASDAENQSKKTLKAAQDAVFALKNSVKYISSAGSLISKRKGDIIVTGIGKPGFIAQKLTASLVSLGERAFYLHPTDALHGDLGVLSKGDVLIALSFSGESREVIGLAKYAKKNFSVRVIAICRDKKSLLGQLADLVIEVPVKDEGSPNGIAPMASTTAMLVICDMIVASVVRPGFKKEHFAKYHPGGSLGLSLKKVENFMISSKFVPIIKGEESFFNAVKEISAKKFGITAVLSNQGTIIGVITDGDIRRFVLKNKDITGAYARDAMTARPKYIQKEVSLHKALELMEHYRITSLFVVNSKKKPVGIIHIHQILEEMVQ